MRLGLPASLSAKILHHCLMPAKDTGRPSSFCCLWQMVVDVVVAVGLSPRHRLSSPLPSQTEHCRLGHVWPGSAVWRTRASGLRPPKFDAAVPMIVSGVYGSFGCHGRAPLWIGNLALPIESPNRLVARGQICPY